MPAYKLIACKVLHRELSFLAANCPNYIDATFIRRGLHNTPELLRKALQTEIDLVENNSDIHTNETVDGLSIEAILIGYGLCSNGIQGLHSSRYPLVVPRGHDCISFFLGSKESYRRFFDSHKGIYWYTRGWMETSAMPDGQMLDRKRRELAERGYDEDDISYLLEMEMTWVKNYSTLAYVSMPGFDEAVYREIAAKAAADLDWSYHELPGDLSLLSRFLAGDWRSEDFLVVPPGMAVAPSFDGDIIKAIPVNQ